MKKYFLKWRHIMKTVNLILIFFIGFGFLIGQEKKSNEIKNYCDLMNEFADSSTLILKKPIEIANDQELKRIARIIYESYADPIGKRYKKKKISERRKLIPKGNKRPLEHLMPRTYGQIERDLLDLLKQEYSVLDYHLITTQSIIRGKVISEKEIPNRFSNNPKIVGGPQKIFIKVLLEDIIKGDSLIKIGDIIDVFYNAYFTNHKWDIGESYLFNLNFTIEEGKPLRIIKFVGDKGFFPVEGDLLNDNNNFFGQGVQIKWGTFKSNLRSEIDNLLFKETK